MGNWVVVFFPLVSMRMDAFMGLTKQFKHKIHIHWAVI